MRTTAPTDQGAAAVFYSQRDNLFVDLLYEMALALGYDEFNKNEIRTGGYYTLSHGEAEADMTTIRKGIADAIRTRGGLPIVPVVPAAPAQPQLQAPQEQPPAPG